MSETEKKIKASCPVCRLDLFYWTEGEGKCHECGRVYEVAFLADHVYVREKKERMLPL